MRCAVCVLLGACNTIYGLDETVIRDPKLSPRAVVFDNSDSATDLDDFQVLVVPDRTIDLTDLTDFETQVRFEDMTGADLPFDIEASTTGVAFWVRVPKIRAHSNKDRILMYFGTDIAHERDPRVWSPEYDLVVHDARGGVAPNAAAASYTVGARRRSWRGRESSAMRSRCRTS